MRLRRLTINALPGIAPGFTFEPPEAGVILVTGPNAIGKSSLARALKHLLGGVDRKEDPPALSLEAEFDSAGTRWQVRRNGGQILWMRDGEIATAPQLPTGDQINLYHLSMESLFEADKSDKALAERIWRDLRGGFDLDALRAPPGSRWGRSEERALSEARKTVGAVERRYAALQAEEAKLPALERDINAAELARDRLDQLQQASALHRAIERRFRSREAIERFSPDMAKLKGDELQRLKAWDKRAEALLDGRREQRRLLEEAQRAQAQFGFQAGAPQAEQVARIEDMLQALTRKASDRKHALQAAAEAQAGLDDAQAQLQGGGQAPNLNSDSLERARKIVEPLLAARARHGELKQQLALVGEPPDESEIDRLARGVEALRTWLAGGNQTDEVDQRVTPLTTVALALAAVAAVAALIEQAFWTLGGVAAAGAAMLGAAVMQGRPARAAPSPSDEAKRAFEATDLVPPEDWSESSVRTHLRDNIEPRFNRLILQRQRAEGAAKLNLQSKEAEAEIDRLMAEKAQLAHSIGIDPELADAPFHRFIDVTSKWDQARRHHEEKQAALKRIESEIADQADRARAFLNGWRRADAPSFSASGSDSAIAELHIAWRDLQERLQAQSDAEHQAASCEEAIRSLERQAAEIDDDVRSLFNDLGLEAEQRDELADRIDRIEEWKAADQALRDAKRDESSRRTALAEHQKLIAAVESGEIERLERDKAEAQRRAEAHTALIEERTGINTRLQEAGANRELERAASALDSSTAQLDEKRAAALRHQAAEALLGDVEGQFASEHEPDLLRRAKARFEQVTAHEFSLELRNGNRFAARDLKQGQLRTLEELSSGTRMQLLLALRLAWTEAQEQGGESLPLFLDEALTTSDEDRFGVMANTLARLAEAGERQIFYLSASRHESALWERATGSKPALVDLAEVRFDATRLDPGDFRLESPPSLPSPADHDAASYAILIGVPRLDPHLEPGGIHLFHLLRDDLELLHRLMSTWRIATLGQVESLLASNAAEGAISDAAVRSQLKQRCKAARAWIELWGQGRGRPVSRGALEQSGVVSATFIDRTAELADELRGDGAALIDALRNGRLRGFRAAKAESLGQWLADEGYTDNQSLLSSDERRRLTLTAAAPASEEAAADVNRLVSWLETTLASSASNPS